MRWRASSPVRAGVAPRAVRLVGGATSRLKRLHIDGDPRALAAALARVIGGRAMTAAADRRQGRRGRIARARADGGPWPRRAATASFPASPWCWSATIPRARSISAPRRRCPPKPACARSTIGSAASTSQAALLALHRRAQRRSATCTAFWSSCRCRRRSILAQVIAAIDPGKDVDGFHPLNVGRIAIGLPALAPCTPLGLHRAGEERACFARRPRCAGDRPLDHRRQAARPASPRARTRRSRWRIPRPGICPRCRGGPISCSRRSAVPNSSAATGSSPARR